MRFGETRGQCKRRQEITTRKLERIRQKPINFSSKMEHHLQQQQGVITTPQAMVV